MIKRFIPTYYAKTIYDVDPQFYQEQNITTLILDLDNTLASYRALVPSKETIAYVEAIKKLGITVYLISNNRDRRVHEYAQTLNVKYLASARKPFTSKIRAFIKSENIDQDKLMLVGDQLLTDVRAANKLGVKVLLCDKLVKEDQWTTKFNRLLDRPIRRRLRRKNLLKEWDDGRRTQES